MAGGEDLVVAAAVKESIVLYPCTVYNLRLGEDG